MIDSLPGRLRASTRLRALLLLWQASRTLSVLAVVFVLAEGALPVLVLVFMGRVTGAIPGAVVFGLGSPPGHRLVSALAVAGAVYVLSLLRGPFEDALTAAAAARVDTLMQRRLVEAVCAPAGIEHLEDQQVLEQLSSARGELLGGRPEGAPMALISLLGDRLTGVLACAVLATFRWWLGLALLVMWLLVRRPLGRRLRFQATRVRQAGPVLRRSWYLLGLAWRPPAAKEMRVFGLGEWTAQRHRDEWLSAMRLRESAVLPSSCSFFFLLSSVSSDSSCVFRVSSRAASSFARNALRIISLNFCFLVMGWESPMAQRDPQRPFSTSATWLPIMFNWRPRPGSIC